LVDPFDIDSSMVLPMPEGQPAGHTKAISEKSSSRSTIFYHDDFKDPREFAL
jgi:hypothetical protein